MVDLPNSDCLVSSHWELAGGHFDGPENLPKLAMLSALLVLLILGFDILERTNSVAKNKECSKVPVALWRNVVEYKEQ